MSTPLLVRVEHDANAKVGAPGVALVPGAPPKARAIRGYYVTSCQRARIVTFSLSVS